MVVNILTITLSFVVFRFGVNTLIIRMWLERTFGTCEWVFTDFTPVAGLGEDGPVVIHIQNGNYQQIWVLSRVKNHCSVHLIVIFTQSVKHIFSRYAVLCHVIYPACDARVVRVVFDGDGESVFSHSLSIQWPVHLKHTWLEERTHQSFQCSLLHYYFHLLFFPSAVLSRIPLSLTVSLM